MSDVSSPPPDKAGLIAQIQAAYAEAGGLLVLVPTSAVNVAGVCGFWSVQDIVAHLTTWEARTLRWLDEAGRGIPLTIPEQGFGWHEFEALNAAGYEANKERAYADILRDFEATQRRMLAAVQGLSEAELRGEGRYAGMFSDSPAEAIAANTYQHYDIHLAQIRAWLAT